MPASSANIWVFKKPSPRKQRKLKTSSLPISTKSFAGAFMPSSASIFIPFFSSSLSNGWFWAKRLAFVILIIVSLKVTSLLQSSSTSSSFIFLSDTHSKMLLSSRYLLQDQPNCSFTTLNWLFNTFVFSLVLSIVASSISNNFQGTMVFLPTPL
ncbi:MAG: hypothetical protein BWY16_00574 [Candidatus Omnitrophica bacterium ADurb.Bin205]|nr:MAG: hypothetical protein BWY16_00574 [Candidatus Omnitrophica bacterium ADurb.Bin205]